MKQESFAVRAKYKWYVKYFSVIKRLLHPCPEAFPDVLGFNDRKRHVRLIRQEVICIFGFCSGMQLAAYHDSSCCEMILSIDLRHIIPSRIEQGGVNESRSGVVFCGL